MQSSGANANGGNGSRSSKKKRTYVRAVATIVTPDQAEIWAMTKIAADSEEFENCSELIEEARKKQSRGR
jgi:hypothetical protein